MQPKILFLLPSNKNIIDFIKEIDNVNSDIVISNRFIDDIQYKDSENIDGFYYLDTTTITSSIKNNSILYITYMNDKMCGVTIDDFYNADVIPMSVYNFNDISSNFLGKYIDDIVIVWYDTQNHSKGKELKREINETQFLMDKIDTIGYKYVYFLDDEPTLVSDIINKIIIGTDEERQEIFENYS